MFFGTTELCLDSDRLYCEKNWIHTSSASGSYGRLAARRNRDQLQNVYNSLQDKIFEFLLHLIAVQCYYGVRNAFQLAFPKYL